MSATTKQMIADAETLSVTESPRDLGASCELFDNTLDMFCYTYSMPGEPEAVCEFCGANHALPGVYGDDAYTSEELEDGADLISIDAYWARVWATRALDILDAYEESCCEKREKMLVGLGL